MARPIGYDPKEVLVNAMNLFWEKGYESTSIQDIVAVTGLKPGSLYNLYGNKEGLFEAVLDTYSTMNLEQVEEVLNGSDDPFKNIESFLQEVVVTTISNKKTNGCLLVKTLLVVPHKDKKIQEHITVIFAQVEALLAKTIQKAVDLGQTTVDAKQFAKFIITTIYGSHVYYKSDDDVGILRQNVQFLLDTLQKKEHSNTAIALT